MIFAGCSWFQSKDEGKKTLRETIGTDQVPADLRANIDRISEEKIAFEQTKIISKLDEIEKILMENRQKIESLEKTFKLSRSQTRQRKVKNAQGSHTDKTEDIINQFRGPEVSKSKYKVSARSVTRSICYPARECKKTL